MTPNQHPVEQKEVDVHAQLYKVSKAWETQPMGLEIRKVASFGKGRGGGDCEEA